MSKFKVMVSVLVVVLICIVSIICINIWNIKTQLDKLYWVAENTHSGMVSTLIERAELMLHQRLTVLSVLVVVTTILVIIGLATGIKNKQTDKVTQVRTSQCLVSVFLIFVLLFVLLTPVVNATVTHYYARVEMDVPSGSHLIDVDGYFMPEPAVVVNEWVTYHIGVGFPSSYEWIGGGYYTEIGTGTVFYIEWMVDGVYNEITALGVSFGEQYHIDVYKQVSGGVGPPPPVGWGTSIYDSDWNLILRKSNVDLPLDNPQILGIAGGESINQANRMKASFSELRWTTYDPDAAPDPILEEGYWDGNKFPC